MTVYLNGRFLLSRQTGVQRFARKITEELLKIYPDMVILTPSTEEDFGVPIRQIGKLHGYAWEQIELPRYLKRQKSAFLLNLASTAPIMYRNQIVTIHDITYIRFPESFSKKFIATYKALVPKIIKNSHHVFTVSEFSKEEISSYFGVSRESISVVYNAASENFSVDGRCEQREYDYYLTVSSPNKHKNISRLIDAFLGVGFSRDTKLLIVGKQEDQVFNSTDVVVDERIVYTGTVSDEELAAIYRGAKGFLFPSLYEGFGIPPVEAQKSGVPVLASYSASLPEILGDSAEYVNPYSLTSIREGIQALEDPIRREKLIALGTENAARFGWQDSAQKVWNVVRNYISDK